MFKNLLLRRAWAACLAVWASAAAFGQAPDLASMDIVQRSVPDGPVAIVRGTPIERDAYLAYYENELITLAQMTERTEFADSDRVKIALGCLAKMVQREILYQEAVKRKLTVPDQKVQEAYEHDLSVLRQRFERKDGQPMTDDDIVRITGQPLDQIRDAVRRSLLIDAVFDQIAKEQNITVTDKEIEEFRSEHPELFQRPDSVHLRQIFIRPKPNPQNATPEQWAAARAEIEKALARVRAGENFEAVARAVSQAPDAQRGGDMGDVPAEKLPSFYAEAVKGMKPGGISGVIQSEYGLHVVQFIESKGGTQVSLEEARPRIETALGQTKAELAVASWCQPIMSDPAQVKVFLHLEQTLATLPESEEDKK